MNNNMLAFAFCGGFIGATVTLATLNHLEKKEWSEGVFSCEIAKNTQKCVNTIMNASKKYCLNNQNIFITDAQIKSENIEITYICGKK